MTRLIDADALKEKFKDRSLEDFTYLHFIDAIDEAPTVPLPDFKEGYKQAILDGKTNYSRTKGKWIYHKDWYRNEECPWECSECGTCSDNDMNFCGECGADMREDEV